MISIISGTNRPQSRTLQVCHIVKRLFDKHKIDSQIIDLQKIFLHDLDGTHYAIPKPQGVSQAIEQLHESNGYLVVCPEYNGSMPGALKYFIDHWEYPKTFEYVPVALIGLGGRFGGLRPVEHLQQVFGYRNAFIFPERVFLFNVWEVLKEGEIKDQGLMDLLEKQAQDFSRFIAALEMARLHAHNRK